MIDLNMNVDVSNNTAKGLINNLNLTSKSDDETLKAVCDDFESYFMQQMLDISLKSTSFAGQGVGSEIIKGLYTENISKASGGTLGISDMLYRFLSENKNG